MAIAYKQPSVNNGSLSSTTAHGLQQIGRSKAKNAFWVFIFINALLLLIVQISCLIDNFTLYPTNDAMKKISGPLEFPAVSFCSSGVVKRSAVRNVPAFQNLESLISSSVAPVRKKREISNITTTPNETVQMVAYNETSAISIMEHVTVIPMFSTTGTNETNISNKKEIANAGYSMIVSTLTQLENDAYSDSNIIEDQEVAFVRGKRQLPCYSYTCYNTSIQVAETNQTTVSICQMYCASLDAVTLTYWYVHQICLCYNTDCCTYSGRYSFSTVYSETHTLWTVRKNQIEVEYDGNLARCSDISLRGGVVSLPPPYPMYRVVNWTCPADKLFTDYQTTKTFTCAPTTVGPR